MQPTDRRGLLLDLAIVVTTLILVRALLQPVTEQYAGMISTASALLLATLRLRRHRHTWLDLGLRWSLSVPRTIVVSVELFIAVIVVVLPITLLADSLFERTDDAARFGELEGNLAALLWWGTLSVIMGGFVEEMVYRGFMLTRLASLLGPSRRGIVLAVALQATFFGFRHYYWQGPVGAVSAFAAAAVFGGAYFVLRRNLWPLILVHAAIDLMGFIEDYFDV